MKPTKQRLKEAMDLRDWGINKLAKALTAKGVRGSSFSSVRNYLGRSKTPSEPRLEFLLAAAEALDVNPDYLAYGKGHLTDARAAAAEVAEDAQGEMEGGLNQLGRDLKKAVLKEMGVATERPMPWDPERVEPLIGQAIESGELTEAQVKTLDLLVSVGQKANAVHKEAEDLFEAFPNYWLAPLGEVWRQLEEAPDNPFRDQGEELISFGEGPGARIARALAEPLKALGVDGEQLHMSGYFGHYILAAIPALLILAREYSRQCRMKEQDIQWEKERLMDEASSTEGA